jgi:hypothetical protein
VTDGADPTALRIGRGIFAGLIAVALTVQFRKSSGIDGFDEVNFFLYLTVLSNISAMVLLAVEAARPPLPLRDPRPRPGGG